MASIRATAQERRFRRVTGLDVALPRRRFALSDPAGYLELQESVKAHTLDHSRSIGRLVSPEEGARHWYDTIFAPILEILEANVALRLLGTMTDADRFLLKLNRFRSLVESEETVRADRQFQDFRRNIRRIAHQHVVRVGEAWGRRKQCGQHCNLSHGPPSNRPAGRGER